MLLQEVIDVLNEITGDDFAEEELLLDEIIQTTLTAIATGQCQDSPPEDFAAELLKVITRFEEMDYDDSDDLYNPKWEYTDP